MKLNQVPSGYGVPSGLGETEFWERTSIFFIDPDTKHSAFVNFMFFLLSHSTTRHVYK